VEFLVEPFNGVRRSKRRRVKTQGSLPSEDGWQKIAVVLRQRSEVAA